MSIPSYPRGRVKGATIRDFVAWYADAHGEAQLRDAIESLAPEYRRELDLGRPHLGILPSDWFRAEVVHGVLDGLTRELDAAMYQALVESAATATVRGLTRGVQRIVFSTLLSPRSYSKVASVAFRLNYETGVVVNEELGPKRHRGRVEDWVSHHPFLCRMNVAIKARMYGVMGCQNVRTEERFCRDEGDADCGSVIVWE